MHPQLYTRLEARRFSSGDIDVAALPEIFSREEMYHFELQVVSPTLTMISYDPAAYLMQLSDGRRYVNIIASMSEEHDGKKTLYMEIAKVRQYLWVRASFYLRDLGGAPALVMHECKVLEKPANVTDGMVGTPTLRLPEYWLDTGCLRRNLRFGLHAATLNLQDPCARIFCVHVLSVLRAPTESMATEYMEVFGVACPNECWVLVCDGADSAWLLVRAGVTLACSLAELHVRRVIRAGVPMYYVENVMTARTDQPPPRVEPASFKGMQGFGMKKAADVAVADCWVKIMQNMSTRMACLVLMTCKGLMRVGGGANDAEGLCGLTFWRFLMNHLHYTRIEWTKHCLEPHMDSHGKMRRGMSPVVASAQLFVDLLGTVPPAWGGAVNEFVLPSDLDIGESFKLYDEVLNLDRLFMANADAEPRLLLRVLPSVQKQARHRDSVLRRLADMQSKDVDAGMCRDMLYRLSVSNGLSFGAIRCVRSISDVAFDRYMPSVMRFCEDNAFDNTRGYEPRYCSTCETTLLSTWCIRCKADVPPLSSPARVRILVQVCSPVMVDVFRTYLRAGSNSATRAETVAVQSVVLAATHSEECLSFDVTDGDTRLAVNVREKRFFAAFFHARQAGLDLSRGFVLLLSLRMQDIQGGFCENVERSFTRAPNPTLTYPGPFQTMAFVAENVELVGEIPALPAVDDVYEPMQCWGWANGGVGGEGGGIGGGAGLADMYEDTGGSDDVSNGAFDDESDWEPSIGSERADSERAESIEL